jgi:hypothetical protein
MDKNLIAQSTTLARKRKMTNNASILYRINHVSGLFYVGKHVVHGLVEDFTKPEYPYWGSGGLLQAARNMLTHPNDWTRTVIAIFPSDWMKLRLSDGAVVSNRVGVACSQAERLVIDSFKHDPLCMNNLHLRDKITEHIALFRLSFCIEDNEVGEYL